MKTLKNYDHFSKQYRENESVKINENVFSDILNKIIGFFKQYFGKHAWVYYALYLQKKGKLPKGIDFICPPAYASVSDLPSDKEIEDSNIQSEGESVDGETVEDEKEKEIPGIKNGENDEEENAVNDEIEEIEKVKESLMNLFLNEGVLDDNDEYVSLEHPDPTVLNDDVAELKKEVIKLYKMNALRAGRHQEEGESGKEYARRKTNAIFIWGAPGIGKTEILHQVARELEIAVIEWHLSQIEPTDFRGIPRIENAMGTDNPADERTFWKLPSVFPTSNGKNGKGGIMFFDEMNRAPQMVLDASLSLALSGKHGSYELPQYWIVIAAGNRGSDLSTGDLTEDKILWNRFQHINFAPKPSDWIGYAKNIKSINPKLVEFIKENPEYYHRLKTVGQAPNWTSPRTWEMASEEDYFERGFDWKNRLSYDEVRDIYEDFVGYASATAFVNFLKKLDEKEREEQRKKEGKDGNPRRGDARENDML